MKGGRGKKGGRIKKGGRSEIYMFQATRRDEHRLIHILEIKFMNTEIKTNQLNVS